MDNQVVLTSEFYVPRKQMFRYSVIRQETCQFNVIYTFCDKRTWGEHVYAVLEISSLQIQVFNVEWSITVDGMFYSKTFKNGERAEIELSKDFLQNQGMNVKISSVAVIKFGRCVALPPKRKMDLFAVEDLKDFVIYVGKQEIKVHKLMLIGSSSVFKAMLKLHCKESIEKKLLIKDFEYSVVMNAIYFIYDNVVDENMSVSAIMELYRFADKYDLLNKVCLHLFIQNCCIVHFLGKYLSCNSIQN